MRRKQKTAVLLPDPVCVRMDLNKILLFSSISALCGCIIQLTLLNHIQQQRRKSVLLRRLLLLHNSTLVVVFPVMTFYCLLIGYNGLTVRSYIATYCFGMCITSLGSGFCGFMWISYFFITPLIWTNFFGNRSRKNFSFRTTRVRVD